MPAKKRSRKYPVNGTVGVARPFPIRMQAKLRYVESIALTSSLTSINQTCFACNSIYDPNLSGGGHQPYGHDTYASIYNQYTVLKAVMKITPQNTTTPGITYGVGIEDTVVGSGTGTSNDYWAERPTYTVVAANLNGMKMGQSIQKTWTRAQRFPHEDLYRTVSAPFGSNPAEIEVFNIVVQAAGNNAIILGTVYFLVEIEYTVEMYEPISLAAS
jgi:hypothetical protein